jgi:hypothetical protein
MVQQKPNKPLNDFLSNRGFPGNVVQNRDKNGLAYRQSSSFKRQDLGFLLIHFTAIPYDGFLNK